MAEAAHLPFDYPEAAVVEEDSLADQNLAIAAELPDRPLVLGGCCSAHVGALEGLSARHDRLALVWLDAHGDLNTPATSPSGNAWGMPLRMIVDAGMVKPENVALIGARNLDPPEETFIAESGIHTGPDAVDRALEDCSCVYVAFDVDSLDPGEITPFMPEPDGLSLDEVERLFVDLRGRSTVVGAGLSGLAPDPDERRAAGAPDPRSRAVTRARASRSNIASWRSPESTSRSRRTTRLLRMRRSIRTPVRSASPTIRDDELEENLWVCSHCGHHFPMRARARILSLADEGSFIGRGRRPSLGRPTRLLRPPALRRAASRRPSSVRDSVRRS